MASSIYVYSSLQDFENFYRGFLNEPLKKINIVDLYIKDKSKLWVVTNSNSLKEKPTLQKSLVHFRNGTLYDYADQNTKLVVFNKIFFNKKKMKLCFFPRFLRKPLLEWHVDRFITNDEKNHEKNIDYSHRYYDFELDRINFILKNG